MAAQRRLRSELEEWMMATKNLGSRGFTLIAALLLLLILSGISIGLLMMVNTEEKVNTQDLQANISYHAAEGGIETMTANLSNLFQNVLAPSISDIEALSALQPVNTAYVSYPVYSLAPVTTTVTCPSSGPCCPAAGPNPCLATQWASIQSGDNAGLYAQLVPINLNVIAQGPLGDETNMSRQVDVALIPVFQFGVFSDSDLGFYSSPNLNFAGRVHTNGDLYLGVANGYTLTFHDKLSAYGNVIRAVLPNGLPAASYNDGGTVLIPTAGGGCDGAQPNCRALGSTQGSVVGAGGFPPQSSYNAGPPSWQTISMNYYGGKFLTDGDWASTTYPTGYTYGTGATDLSLPFVGGTTGTTTGPQPYEIIRRPPTGESATGVLGSSRLFNEAEIRVLLADTPAELPPYGAGGIADQNNIRLANGQFNSGPNYSEGVQTSVVAGLPGLPAGHNYTTYFATATTAIPDPDTYSNSYTQYWSQPDWLYVPLAPPAAQYVTLYDANAPVMLGPGDGVSGVSKASYNIGESVCNPNSPVTGPTGTTIPPVCPTTAAYPYYAPPTLPITWNATTWPTPGSPPYWNLLDGYIRVEYKDSTGNWNPVTQEWLSLGFARGTTPPTTPGTNTVNPNAILYLQEPADRYANGNLDFVGAPPGYTTSFTNHGNTVTYTPYPGKPPSVTKDPLTSDYRYGDSTAFSITQFNWYPINFYDAREGEPRDYIQNPQNDTCTANGVMNAVELDVGNLAKWLKGTIAGSGLKVDYQSQNGYILYFSDRRGMLPNPNGTQVDPANTKTGDSGLEDSVNRNTASGKPDGVLDPIPVGRTISDEDVNENGTLENFGAWNMGLGLGYIPTPAVNNSPPPPGAQTAVTYTAANNVNRKITNAAGAPDPYTTAGRVPTCTIAQNNWVSGARHVLRLVDGSLGNVPVRPDNAAGGFTVGSENPVYILGNYNTNAGDPIWTGGNDVAHSETAVIADAVTVLSNSWSDLNSTNSLSATNPGSYRNATTTYYRVAITAGKSINFPFPSWENSNDYGFGTDGGVHNFLRFIEDWSAATLNYEGSLVSMYYATYATGTFKCCAYSVYQPPNRNYVFDADFTQPQNLPPGTPLFRDVENLSLYQNLTAHTGTY
jgi:competence protein ComGC